MTHLCVNKWTTIGSDNGLSPGRRQAIIWTNAGKLLIKPSETNVSEILFLICTRINGWVNNGEAGDLRHYRAHYDVPVMMRMIRFASF